MLQCVCEWVCVGVFHVSTPIIPIQLCWDRCCLPKARSIQASVRRAQNRLPAAMKGANCNSAAETHTTVLWFHQNREAFDAGELGKTLILQMWDHGGAADRCFCQIWPVLCPSVGWLVGWSGVLWSKSKHCFKHFKIKFEFRGNFSMCPFTNSVPH